MPWVGCGPYSADDGNSNSPHKLHRPAKEKTNERTRASTGMAPTEFAPTNGGEAVAGILLKYLPTTFRATDAVQKTTTVESVNLFRQLVDVWYR